MWPIFAPGTKGRGKRMRKKRTCYLAGPMEYAHNEGINWRRTYAKALEECSISCIIPNDEEKEIKKNINMSDLKENDIEKYIEILRAFIDQDLKFVETVDMIIVRWEGELTTGTVHEVGYAYQLKKPTYLVSSLKNKDIPGWFLACFTKKFSTMTELMDFLKANG